MKHQSTSNRVLLISNSTTKDMPIVQPPSFDALGLVSFQISPHFLDPDPNSTHMGKTQEERILQFPEENDTTVAGLREGAMVRWLIWWNSVRPSESCITPLLQA